MLTHSRQRYRRNLRFYADEPRLQVGGPTSHWVREGMLAGDEVLANVERYRPDAAFTGGGGAGGR